ncbi:signal peptidase I [Streptomyces sp. NBC_00859]|uniref:signal peptidase I n=1 Tax=Streptomyces sp. NBC_00859 TaxID=2903682 RepID=UPI003864C846|nr:signal peptidase I [Streptomyces sp. NBC_00859]
MDTEAQHEERGSSPETDTSGEGERSRSLRLAAMTDGPWRKAGLLVIVCLVFLLLLSTYVMQPFLIPSGSMEPTLEVGDRVLVDKLAYRFGSAPHRGDVVVFDGTGSFVQDAPRQNPVPRVVRGAAAALGLAAPADSDYVKRVVGVGGDHVVCCDKQGRIHVNGRPVNEAYVYPGNPPSQVPFDIVVPEGTLWVMGDHRSRSSDSRDHLGEPGGGMVPVDRVIGRAGGIAWPFSRWGSLERTGAFDRVPAAGATHG